jgi:hypothetical protein
MIPEPRTLQEFDQREFDDEIDTRFSSFAYLIGLFRSLDFAISGRPRDNEDAIKRMCTNADAAIVAFQSYCRKTKRQLITEEGKIDHFIFDANMSIVV